MHLVKRVLIMAVILSGVLLLYNNDTMAAEPNLQWGSRGNAVVQLQKTLNNQGFWCGAADGIFGAKTYNAVINFQKSKKLQVDGIVGPQTRKALGLSTATPSSTQVSRGGERTLSMVTTGYCPCAKCNFPYGGQPSYLGYPLARGIIAVDPNIIPMGTRLYVEGYGSGIAADQGNAIKGNRLDLFFDTHQEALKWGIRTVKVTIL